MTTHRPTTHRPTGRRAIALALVAALLLVAVVWWWRTDRGGRISVDQNEAGPVLLVSGYGGSTGALQSLAAALTAQGRTVHVVQPVGDNTGDLREQAQAVADVAAQLRATGAPPVDVVGYSAGGVVTRVWTAQLDGGSSVRRVVTLGSPHHGTSVASLGARFGGTACQTACQQLAQGSDLLDSLPETPDGPQWTSIWTDQDTVVTPPDSAELAGAVNIEVQSICPDAVTGHGDLPRDPLVIGLVLTALNGPMVREAPSAQSCAALRQAGAAGSG